jgi:transcriptional regulator with XRE-family HTH domain
MTQGDVAARIAVKRQSYAQFENAEALGSLSLASMRKAAEAMDCEFIYFVIPRESAARTYADLAQVHDPTAKHLKATEHSTLLKAKGPTTDGR